MLNAYYVYTQLTVYKTDFKEERQDREKAHGQTADLEKKVAQLKGQLEQERSAYRHETNEKTLDYDVMKNQLAEHQQSMLSLIHI